MPSSANYHRDYKEEYKKYGGTPEQRKNRAARNRAHRALEKALGKEIKQDVDHKKPLIKGGDNSLSNLRILPPSQNRSFKRGKNAGLL
jgi:5-methylcytosine-specific restriction endonuclease McrA